MAPLTALQLLLEHVLVAGVALGVHGFPQGRHVFFGFGAVALITGSRLGLDIRAVMAFGTVVLRGVIFMAVEQFAQFGVVTIGTDQ